MEAQYFYGEGDRVECDGKPYIIGSRYYPNGFGNENEPAYVIYPPGKKKTTQYHVWVYQHELRGRTKN